MTDMAFSVVSVIIYFLNQIFNTNCRFTFDKKKSGNS